MSAPCVPDYECALGDDDAVISGLRDEGFGIVEAVSAAQLALCDQILDELSDYYADPRVNRIQDGWRVSPGVRAMASRGDVLELLERAYGREPFPFQTLNFRRGSRQAAHIDSVFFDSAPARFMAGVWFALEDVAEDAGPLVYYPGSHKLTQTGSDTVLDVLGGNALGGDALDGNDAVPMMGAGGEKTLSRHHSRAVQALIEQHGLVPRTVLLKKGQAAIWTANVMHGGAPVVNPEATRRSLVVHYYFTGCAYLTPVRRNGLRPEVRLPVDIRSGVPRWPRRGGWPILPSSRSFGGAVRSIVARQPGVFYEE